MIYIVRFHSDFIPEWKALDFGLEGWGLKELVGEVLDHLEDDGPFLGRPEVGTLSGSDHANMKEIRVKFGKQVWRFAFAFDPTQNAILLCGGDKQGMSKTLFYKQLIGKADARFSSWLKDQAQ
ncbi:toxin RelE [Agrobacterium vitis]|uniref:type II toxin-antitoxin system RelE/ParE family toxin n=1 Tax=Agrobacterium vitis TaxID=373 RepID=UPI0015DB1EDC|nr:type II toxin-antitoxin system RelE/ParE family toxin [Agrobacterium vitis]BCH65216.1 toxin RelE [Agrobacterium vitis]